MQKVRVSETPGKTKHFQTLALTEDITLCDCPGLVMPSIANSKAGMVLQVSEKNVEKKCRKNEFHMDLFLFSKIDIMCNF